MPSDITSRAVIAEEIQQSVAAQELTQERGKTHGDWSHQAKCAQALKCVIMENDRWAMAAGRREALEMIAVKMSRILCGDAAEPDHWNDIQGYAELGKNDGHR